MKVSVYWNLHKNTFSIQSRESGRSYGRVINHSDSVVIKLPRFVVRQAGQEKVIKEQKKNVHAFVSGLLSSSIDSTLIRKAQVVYNPYKYKSFVIADSKEPVYNGLFALLEKVNNKPIINLFYEV